MAQILKLPIEATKLGYRRVRKGRKCKGGENPDQLVLFAQPKAQILAFENPALSPFEQALLYDDRGDAKAAELYSRAIEQQDCVADALCNLGILESENGNTIKAFDCFTACLKENPRHTEAHYNLANLYFDQNDFRLAQLHFELAIEFDPAFANAFFNLALALVINDDIAGALRTLGRYKQLVSEDEGRIAEETLENLRKSLMALRKPRLSSG